MSANPELLPLRDDEVHLWYVRTERAADAALLERFRDSLCDGERRRWQRFAFEEGRQQFLVSHGFLRAVLSRYAGVPPSGWRFVPSAYGKPEVALPAGAAPAGRQALCFNLTHTHGLAACVVAWDREVGVDAEDWHRRGRDVGDELVRRCLSAEELACYRTLHEDDRKRGFFDYWTLKEAYLKARGLGLSLPVEEVVFRGPSGGPHSPPVEVSFGPSVGDRPDTWQFACYTASDQHRIAVAARRFPGPDLDVIVREFTP